MTFDTQLADERFLEASIEFVQAETEWIKMLRAPIIKDKDAQVEQFLTECRAMRRANEADKQLYRLFTGGKGNGQTLTLNAAFNAFAERLLSSHREQES